CGNHSTQPPPFISPDASTHFGKNDGQHLPPVPGVASASLVLFDKVSDRRVILECGTKFIQEPGGTSRCGTQRHASPSFSCGSPAHSLTRARCVSRTTRSPFDVVRKCRLARPPRSGVASPSWDAINPFSSSRVSASYTLPRRTSLPVVSSISSEID